MRSFLGFVVFVAVLVAVLVFVVGPVVARPVLEALIRDALPFESETVSVSVDVGPSLLGGEVDAVTVSGRDLQGADGSIGTLDLTVRGFSIVSRTFEASAGRLEDVQVRLEDGTATSIDLVELSGPSDAVAATATIDAVATEGLIRSKLAERGIVPERVQLVSGAVEVTAGGLTVAAALESRDGGLYFVPEQLVPEVVLWAPGTTDPWRITDAGVSEQGLVIEATVNVERLLARSAR
ncbi:MAG: DUF2993 domain-containing protein [Chloroflexi bacterium]|nr:DUF2993 domain-containing protein [Chloroflexota bacterium]